MFKKLLSNLPFNPSLIHQVVFYGKRLKKETAIRRVGVIATVLALFVQMFSIFSPVAPTLATSPNDLIYGGNGKTKAGIIAAYQNNNSGHGSNGQYRDVREIYSFFGITSVDQLQNAPVITINSDPANNWWSVGRHHNSSNDHQWTIPGAATDVYQGPLLERQRTQKAMNWSALKVSTANGDVYVLLECGNVATPGLYNPKQNPGLSISKVASPEAGTTVKPGDQITYTLIYDNTGAGTATKFKITDMVPNGTQFATFGPSGNNKIVEGSKVTFWHNTTLDSSELGPHPTLKYHGQFVVKVKDLPIGTKICNSAKAESTEQTVTSNTVCHTVDYCPTNPSLNRNDAACNPTASCVALQKIGQETRTKVNFKVITSASEGAKITGFRFDKDNDGTVDLEKTAITLTNNAFNFDYEYPDKAGSYTGRVTLLTSLGSKTSDTCMTTIAVQPPQNPLIINKKLVKNVTQNIDNANDTVAKPGDVLEYSLISQNLGEGRMQKYTFPVEDLRDVLFYADLVKAEGGEYDRAKGIVSWPNQDIEAKGDKDGKDIVTKVITVRIKDPLPTTPTSTSNPTDYDCKLQNVFGSSEGTVVKLPNTASCNATVVASTLPNTGPGASLTIGFMITAVAAYFFARSRLMAKELAIVKDEYVSGGY